MEKEPGQGVGDSGKMGVNVCSRKVPKWGRACGEQETGWPGPSPGDHLSIRLWGDCSLPNSTRSKTLS